MRIISGDRDITCLADWQKHAGPKREHHWKEHRSAYELAHAWCGAGAIAMPQALQALLDSRDETRGLTVDVVMPEHRITFDKNGGEPRNADLAFVGRGQRGPVAVTIEAKADEPFGETVADTMTAALERLIEHPHSRGVRRVEELVRAIVPARGTGAVGVGALRYQLLTAVAGTLAYAADIGASVAVMVVHEFKTMLTTEEKRRQNDADYWAFLGRMGLGGGAAGESPALLGPVTVPGGPL